MQEITILLKAIHELEFLVAYHKHVITTSKNINDKHVDNLREFYRIYLNMKNLTSVLRNGVWRMYTDNCKLKELNSNLLNKKKKLLNSNNRINKNLSMSNLTNNSNLNHVNNNEHFEIDPFETSSLPQFNLNTTTTTTTSNNNPNTTTNNNNGFRELEAKPFIIQNEQLVISNFSRDEQIEMANSTKSNDKSYDNRKFNIYNAKIVDLNQNKARNLVEEQPTSDCSSDNNNKNKKIIKKNPASSTIKIDNSNECDKNQIANIVKTKNYKHQRSISQINENNLINDNENDNNNNHKQTSINNNNISKVEIKNYDNFNSNSSNNLESNNKNSDHHSSASSNCSSSSSTQISKSTSLSSLAHLPQPIPQTTTIAQAIEETEALLAIKRQLPFNYLHNKINTSRSSNKNQDSASLFEQTHCLPNNNSTVMSSNGVHKINVVHEEKNQIKNNDESSTSTTLNKPSSKNIYVKNMNAKLQKNVTANAQFVQSYPSDSTTSSSASPLTNLSPSSSTSSSSSSLSHATKLLAKSEQCLNAKSVKVESTQALPVTSTPLTVLKNKNAADIRFNNNYYFKGDNNLNNKIILNSTKNVKSSPYFYSKNEFFSISTHNLFATNNPNIKNLKNISNQDSFNIENGNKATKENRAGSFRAQKHQLERQQHIDHDLDYLESEENNHPNMQRSKSAFKMVANYNKSITSNEFHATPFNQSSNPRNTMASASTSSSSSVKSMAYSSSSSASSSTSSTGINPSSSQTSTTNVIHIDRNITVGQEYEYIRDEENEKKRFSKGRVVDELIQTEMDYYKVMKLLYDVYLGPNSEDTIEASQKEAIFCNLKQIMSLSSILLNDFEINILNKSFDEVRIGRCFLKNLNLIKETYAHYTQFIEYSNNILEKNEKVAEVQSFIQNGLNIIKQQTTSAFDLHSLLLKPIQRVLKYPLLLQELIKNTETYHEDYEDLIQSLTCMQEVATYINEIKRRRELIIKYGRRDKDQSSISDKMSKLTIHSMIKKSNRIGMKISNVFRLNSVSHFDEQFDKLESRFRYFEKLIKCFTKDSIQHLSNLKEFLKIQTVTAESIQEYYAENQSNDVKQYVNINATVLNEIYSKNTNFVHEKVLQPLNSLLKYLEIPNKLIQKRHDKLLDYECARSNVEKLKDKSLVKTVQDNLYEAQKNYEALNNQLLEELPELIEKCSAIFKKCFGLYVGALQNIYERIRIQLYLLINQNPNAELLNNANLQFASNLKTFINFDLNQLIVENSSSTSSSHHSNNSNSLNKRNKSERSVDSFDSRSSSHSCSNLNRKASVMSNLNQSPSAEGAKRKNFLFKSPVVQNIFKSFTNSDDSHHRKSVTQSTPATPASKTRTQSAAVKQTDEARERIKSAFKPEDVYRAITKYSGVGITDDINLEIDDIVGVIKRADPCGNHTNWFVDNGIVKGIVSSSILKPDGLNYLHNKHNANGTATAAAIKTSIKSKNEKPNESKANLESSKITNTTASSFDDAPNVSDNNDHEKSPSHSFVEEADSASVHNYVNSANNVPKDEFCMALYTFEALDETTLTVIEGEKLKILQKHDDNMNDEWWLLEKLDENGEHDPSKRPRGYVPSNYVELFADSSNNSNKSNVNQTSLNNEDKITSVESSFANTSQGTENGSAVI